MAWREIRLRLAGSTCVEGSDDRDPLDFRREAPHALRVSNRPNGAPGTSVEVANTADDRRRIARIQSGDAIAFESLFREFAPDLASLAFSYLHARDDAEDIVQSLFVWLWANRHSFNPQHGLRAYLFGAARNRALNALRDAQTASRALARFGDDENAVPAADAELIASELRRIVEETVRDMPPRCREVFTLVRTSQLSYAEVGTILGIAPKTVEVHMGRALAILRARLGPHFER